LTVLGPLALYVSLALADDLSSRAALRRPGTYEAGIGGPQGRALQVGALTAGDLAIQWKVPKLRWVYRGLATVAVGLVVLRNHGAGR
jgi:hypothetical protein